ncbi:MAG: DEAD/DEAH box helicase family protein [Actinomycetia bacterium]|nr:DEAD/DEAH box helicase family protein [Actinomycetes bacterium]
MQDARSHAVVGSDVTSLVESAHRAEDWAGEPFLRNDDLPEEVLAAGKARRQALDAALAEIEAGRRSPSADWKVKYALMLGLERVLGSSPPKLASGTELRRHQVDALAGMLTELIARHETPSESPNGDAGELVVVDVDEDESVIDEIDEEPALADPGAERRYRFRHPTASGKTIAAAGFVEAARTMGVLILTHRRLLVSQFNRDLTTEGYGERFASAITGGHDPPAANPITIQTYAWFARHVDSLSRSAYQLVICDEAHTALGEKTSAAIRRLTEPIYIGMTATEQLIAKQVSDVFPASVDDLPLGDAARRGLIAPLRSLRVPPAAAVSSVPIVGGDYDPDALAKVLDHELINQAAASLYRDRFGDTPGIVYAAGVEHAYNLGREFRAAGLKAEAVSGRTPPVKLAETLAAYERGEINVLINAQLLAEGWNSPRATVCMHLAPTASKRVYQQRIGRIMRTHPRKEAGIVVDFVDPAATHNERTVTIHSLLDSDFYRRGARVTPAPRRRIQRRVRRRLSPASWLVPVTPDPTRRLAVIAREWQRTNPSKLADDEQKVWARLAGRQVRIEERQAFAEKLAKASKQCRELFLMACAAENPNRRLRLAALGDRVSTSVSRADFDDLVTIVSSSPTWENDRIQGLRILLRAIGEGKVDVSEDILARWTWRLAKASRKIQDRQASAEFPEAKRLLGTLANSRRHRHEENAGRLVNVALEQPIVVAAALLASAEGYTPTAQQLIERARERIGTIHEVANALADNLPQPKSSSEKRRRRKKRKKEKSAAAADTASGRKGAGDQVQPGSDAPAEMQGEVEPDGKPGSPQQSSQRQHEQQPTPAEHNGVLADADEAAAQVTTAVGSAPADRQA